MSNKYTDQKIPQRPGRGGGFSRSSSSAPESKWNFVTADELLYGNRRKKYDSESLGLNETFSKLLDMISDYQVTDNGRAEAFHRQAEFMESYETPALEIKEAQYHSGSYHHLYIGYQEMDLRELKDYFAWRTLIRKKRNAAYRYGFATLYAAELISLGSEDPGCTFAKLLELQAVVTRQLREQRQDILYTDRSEGKTISEIIRDFVICWGPDAELIQEYCVDNISAEQENVILGGIEGADDLSIIRLIQKLVEGRVRNSSFFQEAGEDAWRVVARVFRRVCEEQKRAGRENLAEKIRGRKNMHRHKMYDSLPCTAQRENKYYIEVSPATAYNYKYGKWYKYSYSPMRDAAALRELSALVRECERILRKKMHYRNQLQNKQKDPRLEQLISEEYERWIQEKERRNRPEIHVDLSKLARIRNQADVTRDRLLEGIPEGDDILLENALNMTADTEGVGRKSEIPEGEKTKREIGTGTSGIDVNNLKPETLWADKDTLKKEAEIVNTKIEPLKTGAGIPGEGTGESNGDEEASSGFFDNKQTTFLRLLLDGADAAGYLKELKVVPSVFVDAINEAAFDEIGDTIVEEDGKSWRLVEDYVDDVKDML